MDDLTTRSVSGDRLPRLAVVMLLAGVVIAALAGCSGAQPARTQAFTPSANTPSKTPATAATLSRFLGCSEQPSGSPVSSVPGATAYSCSSSNQALADWSAAAISYGEGETTQDPGPAPQFAQLVLFTSIGARDIYERMDQQVQAQETAETDPVLKRVNLLEADLPDVVGPNWIEWGNDVVVSEAADNYLHGQPTSPFTPPSATSNAPDAAASARPTHPTTGNVRLACTIDLSDPNNPAYVIDPGPSAYRGKAEITLTERVRGITFPVQPTVQVGPSGSSQNRHQVPLDDSGANAEPDSCTAAPVP